MDNFIIKPRKQEFARVYDNTFLWNEGNIYVMANHRLALWCWLQSKDIFNKDHSLIHIDKHTDARRWEASGEQDCLEKILLSFQQLKELKVYESFQCPLRDILSKRNSRPCITWDNFVFLAVKANLFKHHYIYSSVGDWDKNLSKTLYTYYSKTGDISNLAANIRGNAGKCVVDIDFDFFDLEDENETFRHELEEKLLNVVFETIADLRDSITTITISLNESPGDELWDKRQKQLEKVKTILEMDVPVPIASF